MEAGLGMDDADVGHDRLGEHARDVAFGERGFEGGHVVELDDAGRHRRIDGRPEVAGPGFDRAVSKRHERLVHRSVVAPVEDQDLRPPGEVARQPDGETIRVGRGERGLPVRETETAGELLAQPHGVLGRQHERHSAARLRGDGVHGGGGRVPRHGAGVSETQVEVIEPVGVPEVRARAFGHEQRESGRPIEPSSSSERPTASARGRVRRGRDSAGATAANRSSSRARASRRRRRSGNIAAQYTDARTARRGRLHLPRASTRGSRDATEAARVPAGNRQPATRAVRPRRPGLELGVPAAGAPKHPIRLRHVHGFLRGVFHSTSSACAFRRTQRACPRGLAGAVACTTYTGVRATAGRLPRHRGAEPFIPKTSSLRRLEAAVDGMPGMRPLPECDPGGVRRGAARSLR